MRKLIVLASAATVVSTMGLADLSRAGSLYLDVNDTGAGSGIAATGTKWDAATTSDWSTDSTGASAASFYVNDGTTDAVLAAGTDSTIAYNLTLSGTLFANSLTFEEGKVHLYGNTASTPSLTLGAGGVNVNVTAGAPQGAPTFDTTLPVTIGAEQTWSTSSASTTAVNSVVTFDNQLTLRRTPGLTNASNYSFSNAASTGAAGIVIGDGAANPATLQIAGDEVVTGGVLTSGPMGTGTISLNGGRISSNGAANARTISNAVTLDGTVAQIGGQSNVGTLTFNNTFTVNATADGGSVTLDSGTGTKTQALNFNGGTILKGNITFNSAGLDTATFNGSISDDAVDTSVGKSITKIGTGKIIFTAANTYSGGTTLNAGTLQVTTGDLGAGDVSVTGGTLDLENASSISDLASLAVTAGTVNLGFSTGVEQVAALTVGGTSFANGIYSASDLGSNFTGTGSIQVLAVPEPTSACFLLLGAIPTLVRRRRDGRNRV